MKRRKLILNIIGEIIHEKKAKLQEENKEITASALVHLMKAMTKKTEENAGGN